MKGKGGVIDELLGSVWRDDELFTSVFIVIQINEICGRNKQSQFR